MNATTCEQVFIIVGATSGSAVGRHNKVHQCFLPHSHQLLEICCEVLSLVMVRTSMTLLQSLPSQLSQLPLEVAASATSCGYQNSDLTHFGLRGKTACVERNQL